MIRETGMQQQYCLRWNNHKNNLLTVFGELFRNEDFTDVTLACEGGSVIKCHKMVLAASSSYFQKLFSHLPYDHPVVVLKDIRYSEMQAILEYMYKGEVSITQEEVEPLLRVAEALKVKGLVGENNHRSNKNEYRPLNNNIGASLSSSHVDVVAHSGIARATASLQNNPSDRNNENVNDNSTNENQSYISDDKIDRNGSSLPLSISMYQSLYSHKNAYFHGKSSNADRSDYRVPPLPIWPMTGGLPTASFPSSQTTTSATAAILNSCQEAIIAANNASMSPLKRKKLSGSLMNRERDTPILRTVLGQGQADALQPVSLVCHDNRDEDPRSNGPTIPQDISYMNKVVKMETMSEDGHSTYLEASSFIDEDFNQERGSKIMDSSPPSPPSFYMESKGSVSANGVQSQQQEYKRYKQYTKSDILLAIESVRNGMTALKAAKKFGVPSRTLYDKVKKLGITTTRPFRKSNAGNGTAFPYGISGASSTMLLGMPMQNDDESSSQEDALEHGFLQDTLESDKAKIENLHHETAPSMARSLQSYEFLGHNFVKKECMRSVDVEKHVNLESREQEPMSLVQGNASGLSSSPTPPNDRSPSPNLIKYARRSHSITPSPPLSSPAPPPDNNYQDEVEDLSMSKKPEHQSRVIMPPMNQATAAAMLANCGADNERN